MSQPPSRQKASGPSSPNTVGEDIQADNGRWHFGEDIPQHFSSHVRRSVPYYDDGHRLAVKLSDYFVQPDSQCCEIGCSTGTLLGKLAQHHPHSVSWLGIDKEPAMIEQAHKELQLKAPQHQNMTLVDGDALLMDLPTSDLMVAYYTIQFVPPRQRQELINKIYESLNWGGGFIFFEKIRGADARFQDMLTGLYNDYKLDQGYSGDEIIAKSRALKGVLEPFSEQGNIDLLKRAGFVDIMCVFRYLNFAGFVCIK